MPELSEKTDLQSEEQKEDERAGDLAESAGAIDEATAAAAAPLTGKAATQERILVAATELFLTRGYDNTTIAQVAAHAEVSRATVFWHFSDKESLFRECFNRLCEPFRRSLAQDQSALPPEKRLRQHIELYRAFTESHHIDVKGFIRWAFEHPNFRDWLERTILDLHNRFGGVLTEIIAEIVPPHVDPQPIAMSILYSLHGGMLLAHFDTAARSAELRRAGVDAIVEMIPRRVPTPH